MVSEKTGNEAVIIIGMWIFTGMTFGSISYIDYLIAIPFTLLVIAFGWQKEKNHD